MGLQYWQAGGAVSDIREEAVENSKREMFMKMFWAVIWVPIGTQIMERSTADMHINICIGLV